MKILHAATFGNPLPGSFIPNVVALARSITMKGGEFTFVSMHVAGATWHAEVLQAGAKLIVVSNQREAYRAVVRERPDVIHTHFLGYTVPATLAAWTTRAPLFWHVHTGLPPANSASRRMRGWLRYRALGARVRKFVAVSHALAEQLHANGASTQKTVVIENAIDVEHYRPPEPRERTESRRALNLADNEVAVAFFGRDRQIKGTDVLLRSLHDVSGRTVIAVGVPSQERGDIERRARTIAFDRVADPRAIYWAADALVMPSRVEAAPYTMMEALSCGLPVIASDLPATREIGRDSPVQFIPVDDPVRLASALNRIAPLNGSIAETPARGRFGIDRWVRDVLALYE